MSRVKRGFKARRRRKKVLRSAKGYFQSRSKIYSTAREAVMKAWTNAYRHRKQKKRDFRSLWITRINAACRLNGASYSKFIKNAKDSGVELDRKVMADIAVRYPDDFAHLVNEVQRKS